MQFWGGAGWQKKKKKFKTGGRGAPRSAPKKKGAGVFLGFGVRGGARRLGRSFEKKKQKKKKKKTGFNGFLTHHPFRGGGTKTGGVSVLSRLPKTGFSKRGHLYRDFFF